MPAEQELSPEQQAAAVANEAAASRKRAVKTPLTIVSTTTHGKLSTPRAELEPGWVGLHAPIVDTAPGGGELAEVEQLWLPSTAVRQVVRAK